jgi:lipopolysaccharide export system permease protein
LILNVARQSGSRQFGGMQVFELSASHNLIAIGRAASATAASHHEWLLGGYTESRFTDGRVVTRTPGRKVLESNVTAGFLGLAVQDPEQLTLRALWQLIGYFHANSLDARQYLFAFWSRIARTVAIAFAVLFAIPFVLGPMRSASAGTRTLIGLVIGIGFFLLQRLIESGTIVFHLDPVIVAWLPTTLLATVTLLLLARAR